MDLEKLNKKIKEESESLRKIREIIENSKWEMIDQNCIKTVSEKDIRKVMEIQKCDDTYYVVCYENEETSFYEIEISQFLGFSDLISAIFYELGREKLSKFLSTF